MIATRRLVSENPRELGLDPNLVLDPIAQGLRPQRQITAQSGGIAHAQIAQRLGTIGLVRFHCPTQGGGKRQLRPVEPQADVLRRVS